MSGTSSKKGIGQKDGRTKIMFVRVSEHEYQEIQDNAHKYSSGNLSHWVRERSRKPMLDVSIKMQDEIDEGVGK